MDLLRICYHQGEIMRFIYLFLLLPIVSFAAVKIPKNYNIKKINLNNYMNELGKKYVIEGQDSKSKGQDDIFIVFEKKGKAKNLSMQLFDLNRDKKIDLVKHFEGNKFIRSEADLDYDGNVDVASFFDTETKELKQKILSDGQQLIWKYWHKNELRKKEIDRNADSKPDMWVFYRNGKLVKTEVDDNYDGKVDK